MSNPRGSPTAFTVPAAVMRYGNIIFQDRPVHEGDVFSRKHPKMNQLNRAKIMTTRECVANRIIELCRERNMTINGLARLSALPPSTLKNIVNGVSQNPGIVTIKKLCDGLEITLIEFFDTKEFRALEQEIQ